MKQTLHATGNLNIPAELLNQLGWKENDLIEIMLLFDKIILTKAIPSCVFCRSALELVKIGEYHICKNCIEYLHQANGSALLHP